MAEEKTPSESVISNAVRTQRQSADTPDRSRLSKILVKSPRWKKNTLQGVDAVPQGEAGAGGPGVEQDKLKASLLDLIERHWLALVNRAYSKPREEQPGQSLNLFAENDDIVDEESLQQAEMQARHEKELQQLQERVVRLETSNAMLAALYEDEVRMRETELSELQAAFDQFQQESDELLNELDQQAECLLINISE